MDDLQTLINKSKGGDEASEEVRHLLLKLA